MPLAGKGMLLTSMDIDAAARGRIQPLVRPRASRRARRDRRLSRSAALCRACKASPKYLCLYSTETFEVLDSPAYRAALANQTDWSKANMARFKNMIRAVARITISRGTGRGAALGIIRLRPAAGGKDSIARGAARRSSIRPRSTASSRCI